MVIAKHMEISEKPMVAVMSMKNGKRWASVQHRKWRELKDYEVWNAGHESGKAECARV